MLGILSPARGARAPPGEASAAASAPDGETLAWLLVVPCGLLLVGAVLLLGAPVGRVFFAPLDADRVWMWNRSALATTSHDEAGYLLAVAAAFGLALAIVACAPAAARLGPRAAHAPRIVRFALAALALACVVTQYRLHYPPPNAPVRARYFTAGTWLVAAAAATGIVLAIRSDALRARLRELLRERPGARPLSLALAVLVTAAVMTASIDSDVSVMAHEGVHTITAYAMDETFAVVNGLTPFVELQPLYATLWPLVLALPLTAIAPTLLVFTLSMYALSVAALLAVFGVLRRVTGSSPAALLLYLPFLATSLFRFEASSAEAAYSAGSYYPAFPLRYAGPYLLAWLTARTLDPHRHGSRRLLFLAAGLVALNNANFGLPALVGTLAAVLCASGPLRRPLLLDLARDLAIGLLAAAAALCALTLVRAGALPDLGRAWEYSSLFLHGYFETAIPRTLGLHVLLYLTFAGALAAATVRAIGGSANRVLTGMLAWSGVFGLGAGSYFVAESGPFQMRILFSSWALALALLAVLVVERLAARPRRWPTAADAAVLLGVGVMICSLPQLPQPWTQLQRVRTAHVGEPPTRPLAPDDAQRSWIASLAWGRHDFHVRPGAPVALLLEHGHRLADGLGVVNVNPYGDLYTLPRPSFLRRVVADLRRAGGNTIVMPADTPVAEELGDALADWGFALVTPSGVERGDRDETPVVRAVGNALTAKWVDQRNLRPAALRGDRGSPAVSYPPR